MHNSKKDAFKRFYFELQQGKVSRSKVEEGKFSKKSSHNFKEYEKENSEINS